MALLESAVAAPQAGFGGRSAYKDICEVAAAHLFFICKNHPFIDGNKRAALGACMVFVRLNGIEAKPNAPEWEELTMAVAAGAIDREEATKKFRRFLPKQYEHAHRARTNAACLRSCCFLLAERWPPARRRR